MYFYQKGFSYLKVTISDIAQTSGVSTATVSRVIAGAQNVKPATAQRVLDTMRKLNYQAKPIEVSLPSNLSKSIAIVVEGIADPTYVEIIGGIQKTLSKKQFLSIICTRDGIPVENFLKSLGGNVAGIIFLSILDKSSGLLSEIADTKTPLLAIHRCSSWSQSFPNSIISDDFQSVYKAVRYLVELGHKDIMFINLPEGTSGAYEGRMGYEKAMADSSLPVKDAYIIEGNTKRWTGRSIGQTILTSHPEVTAVLCSNESLAWGVADCFGSAGLSIPDNISLMTLDISSSQIPGRKLTSSGCRLSEMAEVAALTIMDFVHQNENGEYNARTAVKHKYILPSYIFNGSTTAPPPAK